MSHHHDHEEGWDGDNGNSASITASITQPRPDTGSGQQKQPERQEMANDSELDRIAGAIRDHAGYGRNLDETALLHMWAASIEEQSALLREALGLLEEAPVPLHQPESYLTWAAKRTALLSRPKAREVKP